MCVCVCVHEGLQVRAYMCENCRRAWQLVGWQQPVPLVANEQVKCAPQAGGVLAHGLVGCDAQLGHCGRREGEGEQVRVRECVQWSACTRSRRM